MPFELVVVTKSQATEEQAKGNVSEIQLVADGTLFTLQPVLSGSLENALYLARAELVFSDWLDILQELPDGQAITLWRVTAHDDGTLFMLTYVGIIDQARLPRACKIERKG